MVFQAPEKMDEFLKPTVFCDCENILVINKAKELSEKAEFPKEAARRIFNFVRDEIPYGIDFPDVKASATLKKGYGNCVTKTNLQIALLRAIKIPSRYHQVVLSKDVIKGIIPDMLFKKVDERIWYHPWCECYLSEKWIACDSYMDSLLYEAAFKKGILAKEKIPSINWDGESDLKTAASWIIEDVGIHSSYDDICKKIRDEIPMPKLVFKMALMYSNHFTNTIRKK